jgi:pyruvate formate lyase activating enzyme
MQIADIITSFSDYPKHMCSTVFTIGCNLRCPFCHNGQLIDANQYIKNNTQYDSSNESIFTKLLERQKVIGDYVCISGGEPTIQPDLVKFLKQLKESKRNGSPNSFKIKLDTNGTNPKVLKECLPYLDYVALDIKTSFRKYHKVGKRDYCLEVLQSVLLLKKWDKDYEFRITCVPTLVDKMDIKLIAGYLIPAKKIVLQQFVPKNSYDPNYRTIVPYGDGILEEFKECLRFSEIKEVEIK